MAENNFSAVFLKHKPNLTTELRLWLCYAMKPPSYYLPKLVITSYWQLRFNCVLCSWAESV